LADGIDCSVKNTSLLEPDRSMDAYAPAFRCYSEAQTCIAETDFGSGTFQNHPATFKSFSSCTDDNNWLWSVQEYVGFFTDLKQGLTGNVLAAAIIGDSTYSNAPSAFPGGPAVPSDAQLAMIDVPGFENADSALPSCSSGAAGSATPSHRLNQLVEAFT